MGRAIVVSSAQSFDAHQRGGMKSSLAGVEDETEMSAESRSDEDHLSRLIKVNDYPRAKSWRFRESLSPLVLLNDL